MFNTLDLHLFSNDVIVFYFRAMSFGLKCISYEKKKKKKSGAHRGCSYQYSSFIYGGNFKILKDTSDTLQGLQLL